MANGEQENTTPPSGGSVENPTGNQHPPPYTERPAVPSAGPMPGPPPMLTSDRVHSAYQRRSETDYIFDYWTALGWTILTLGIYGLYVFYQLVRRMPRPQLAQGRLLDATLAFAWEEAGRRGLQEELTPSFQRASAHMDVLRRMSRDFRDPVVWLVLAICTRHRGDHRLRALGPGSGEARSCRGGRGVRAVADLWTHRPSRTRSRPSSRKGPEQLRREDRGHGLFVGHLPLLVVLQPDERPEPPLRGQLAPGGRRARCHSSAA